MLRPDRKPRFLFVNENIGGHRTVHSSLRKIFADRGDIDVEFIDGEAPGPLGRLLRAPVPGLDRLDLDLQPLRGQLVHSWAMRRRVRRRLAAGGIDALHVYTQNTMLGGARILRSIPTVITTDSTGRLNVFSIPYRRPTRFTAPLSRLNLIFERPVLQAATKVFANTRKVVDSLRSADYRLPPRQVSHLEMGVYSPYLTEPLPVRDPARHPGIVFIGTTLERKGGTMLLDIWRRELKDRADLTLITLEQVPAEPGLTVVNDLQPGDARLWEILARADIMCFPSVIDQAPNAILEAMAAGLPVIAHPNGAVPEMVLDGETGFLVDCHRREPVADALKTLIDDPYLRIRMGEEGHRHVREHYNMADSASVIVDELLATVTGGRRTSAASPDGEGDGTAGILRFRIHHTVDAELEAQWDELTQRCSTRFASRPSYGLSWYRTLGRGDLAIAAVYRGDRLVGLLPLHTRKRVWVTVHRWLGHGLGTIGEVLAEDGAALDKLVTGVREAGILLELTHVPEDSPLLAALLDSGGWTVEYTVDDHCPVMDVPRGTTPGDLRSAKTLKRLRVLRSGAAKELGTVGFTVLRTPEELRAHWPDMLRVTRVSEEADRENRLNLFGEGHAAFTERFLAREARRGHLCVIGLTVDSVWVAFDVMFRTGERAEAWFTAFDPAYGKLAPGHQLIEHSVRIHDELGITQIDQMIGRNPYKQAWQTSEYAVGTVFAVPVSRSGLLPLAKGANGASDVLRPAVGQWRRRVAVPAGEGQGT
ncbi:GNAT family N-acetyltransferase [Corynebacterium halotolerans]|nr:GNAT family N-acetyltransferase [Corynebacterium halotolerans]